ncbi:cell number regulator 2-like isoform X2 [Prosopis cineraria]|uniref:cell number regulator 2-like isoform X2 n=1 Tax=Prosopis cineraria TaxID=364024 RepID=UPI0024103E37|nr:cell number regulator 2-like isoform X2 [Prosopis cineraria]
MSSYFFLFNQLTFKMKVADHPRHGQWTTGLCGCFEDPGNCCMTCCCPCITFGESAEVIDKGNTSCACAGLVFYALSYVGCVGLYSCTYRRKLRGLFNLPEEPCSDRCIHCCCTSCAICQEYRELRNRGIDPSLVYR